MGQGGLSWREGVVDVHWVQGMGWGRLVWAGSGKAGMCWLVDKKIKLNKIAEVGISDDDQ